LLLLIQKLNVVLADFLSFAANEDDPVEEVVTG